MQLRIPKLRTGSYFPDWLLQPRRRAEQALIAVVAECYVKGVSTRRVDGLVKTLGIDGISKSQVSELAKSLDEAVAAFRTRPLDAGPYTYVWIDALTQKCREGGRIVNVAALCASAVNADGHREILGLGLITAESGCRMDGVPARSGCARPVECRPGDLGCPRRPHRRDRRDVAGRSLAEVSHPLMRNLLTQVPKAAQAFVATLVRSIFAQPDAASVRAQHGRIVEQLQTKFADAAAMLEEAGPDILAFASFPKEHWRQIWSNNPQERLNREIRRRTDVVSIFPNRDAIIRLVGALLSEQHDEWAVARRYMSVESLTKARMHVIDGELEEVTAALPAAV